MDARIRLLVSSQRRDLHYKCQNPVRIPPRPSGSIPDECIMHALAASMRINLRSPPGGSTTRYVSGTFNGMHFAPFDSVTQFMDFGKDSYAVQFFSGTSGGDNALLPAWAANIQYASLIPTAQEGVAWRGHASGACTAYSS